MNKEQSIIDKAKQHRILLTECAKHLEAQCTEQEYWNADFNFWQKILEKKSTRELNKLRNVQISLKKLTSSVTS